jgi:hypothetical protein
MVGKIILRRKKTTAGFAILFLVGLFLAFNFTSTCACLNPDEELVYYVGLKSPRDLRSDIVAKGFEKHLPKGSHFVAGKLLRLGSDGEQTFSHTKDTFVCEYWIESSAVAKRGYRVELELSEDSKVLNVKANAISSWFGIEFNRS